MPSNSSEQTSRTILLIAASCGLGLAMAGGTLSRGWNVVGTLQAESGRTKVHDLADKVKERLKIETLDICEQT